MGEEALRTSDVADADDAPFDPWPAAAGVHVEWGVPGALLAAKRGDLVVIVDVLSFSTSVVEVVGRDGVAFCYSPEDLDRAGAREAVGRMHDAIVLAKHRRVGASEVSLSPASLQSIPIGQRVVMTSLNGGRCAAAAAGAPWVAIGCLTNRTATARRIEELLAGGTATRCTVVPCAEVWSGPFMASQVGDLGGGSATTVRPSVEDLLGAGAIVAALDPSVPRSVEAVMAAAVFESHAERLAQTVRDCVSGRELRARGFDSDVEIAVRLDAHAVVPERVAADPARRFARHHG
jgi:2-phosphosulfolactate phosphatase